MEVGGRVEPEPPGLAPRPPSLPASYLSSPPGPRTPVRAAQPSPRGARATAFPAFSCWGAAWAASGAGCTQLGERWALGAGGQGQGGWGLRGLGVGSRGGGGAGGAWGAGRVLLTVFVVLPLYLVVVVQRGLLRLLLRL